MFGLALLFVYVFFFCPFSILITLLGDEGAYASACGSSWTFLFTFLLVL